MSVRAAAACALFAIACSGSARRAHNGEIVVRVSASHGLGDLVPGPSQAGSSAYALDLVFDELAAHADLVEQAGTTVVLERRSRSSHDAAELAASLRFEGLVSARAEGERLIVEFEDEAHAAWLARMQDVGFAVGPFELDEEREGLLRLRARDGTAIDVLEIVEVPGEQQWRRILARDIEVVPAAESAHRHRIDDVASIRKVDLQRSATYAVFFNLREPALAPMEVRRALADAVASDAVAAVACGDPDCAAPAAFPGSAAASLPRELEVMVLESEHGNLLAAEVLRHQLRSAGVAVRIEAEALEEFARRNLERDFQAVLLPFSHNRPETHRPRLLLTGHPATADEEADPAALLELLREEAALVPLYEARYFAAIDSRLCGGAPEQLTSWRWIADLHPCEPGSPP